MSSSDFVKVVFRLYHLPDYALKSLRDKNGDRNGVHVALLGSIDELGDWELGHQLTAKPSSLEPNVWEVNVQLPACSTFEVSWLVADGDEKILFWDPSDDHGVRLSYHDAVVQASWNRDPTYFISRTCTLILNTHYYCTEGEVLAAVGSAPCLGSWNLQQSVLAHEYPRGSGNWQSDGCIIREAAKELFAEAKEQSQQDNVKAFLPVVILCLMKFFNEKEESLFLVVDATKTATEVEEENNISWPRMVFLGDSYLKAEKFMVLVDGRVLVKRMTSFISSLAVLFGSYYVFNIQYPASAVATLEFMQRCFFEINPDKGSKANKKKKSSAVNPKVLKLIHQLSSFEWYPGMD